MIPVLCCSVVVVDDDVVHRRVHRGGCPGFVKWNTGKLLLPQTDRERDGGRIGKREITFHLENKNHLIK